MENQVWYHVAHSSPRYTRSGPSHNFPPSFCHHFLSPIFHLCPVWLHRIGLRIGNLELASPILVFGWSWYWVVEMRVNSKPTPPPVLEHAPEYGGRDLRIAQNWRASERTATATPTFPFLPEHPRRRCCFSPATPTWPLTGASTHRIPSTPTTPSPPATPTPSAPSRRLPCSNPRNPRD